MIKKTCVLLLCTFSMFSLEKQQTDGLSFDQLVANSERFDSLTPFPTQANRIAVIAKNDSTKAVLISAQAQRTRPLLHKKAMRLIKNFLAYKRKHGTRVERRLYKHMDEYAFIDRLLIKRPLMFMTADDQYLLRDGKKGFGGFEAIGTSKECAPLVLADYLSYDEMLIAALVGVSTPTFFINSGSRTNRGVPGKPGSYQEAGIYIGLVGARFEKEDLMEFQHILITPKKSKVAVALRALWEDFYGETFATFDCAQADTTGRYLKLNDTTYFDTVIYKKRMRLVLELFLVDANQRGIEVGKKVYCHVVGLGLGVWQKTPEQARLILEVYRELLDDYTFSHISDIDFSWFPANSKLVGTQNIKIHFSQRNPADKLTGSHAEKLLVAMYAWDGNAYPGNEYWAGALTASGDPAAACCSTIAELQNPLINTNLTAQKLFVVG